MTNDAPAQASVEARSDLVRRLNAMVAKPGRDWRSGEEFVHGVHSQDIVNILREAAAALSPPPTVGAEDEASLFHVTGERITRKDLNNAYRSGQENGRLAAHMLDGVATRPSPSAVEGWQDISTAPMDGTEALVTGFIFNDPSKGRWQQVAAWNGYEWATEQAPVHPPTHWKPLDPEPVSCIASEKGGL